MDPGHAMDLGKTPMGGFSNGSREFGIMNATKPRGCRVDADCSAGLACDAGLGYLGARYDDEPGLTLACVEGDPGCNSDTMRDVANAAVSGSGFCVDRGSTIASGTPAGRVASVALAQRVGLRSESDPRLYTENRVWLTNRFVNVTVRTVGGFEPAAARQDYTPARGDSNVRRVFLWGRPGFIGVAASGRTLGVYFAYVDMPAGPGFSWEPRYYTGSDAAGRPQFSTREQDAVALDLDSTAAGVQAAELHDVVNQMSVAWVAPLGKWVMFYGGGMSTLPTRVAARLRRAATLHRPRVPQRSRRQRRGADAHLGSSLGSVDATAGRDRGRRPGAPGAPVSTVLAGRCATLRAPRPTARAAACSSTRR